MLWELLNLNEEVFLIKVLESFKKKKSTLPYRKKSVLKNFRLRYRLRNIHKERLSMKMRVHETS